MWFLWILICAACLSDGVGIEYMGYRIKAQGRLKQLQTLACRSVGYHVSDTHMTHMYEIHQPTAHSVKIVKIYQGQELLSLSGVQAVQSFLRQRLP